ncbi:weak toxin 1-like [Pituophis catenifer annectens]|uniref:weak toxin 1-like n=1 Tax=Pituophis catenifer annectens TaxID=94852 RepID=UPI003994EDFC
MKTHLPVVLLTIVVQIKKVPSLECYTCNQTSYSGCTRIKNCSHHEVFCTRYTATSLSGFLLQKGCAVKCPISKTTWPSLYTLTCCQEDRCNHMTAVRCSKSLLAVTLVFGALIDLEL